MLPINSNTMLSSKLHLLKVPYLKASCHVMIMFVSSGTEAQSILDSQFLGCICSLCRPCNKYDLILY